MRFFAAVLILFASAVGLCQEVKLPAEVSGDIGQFITVTAVTTDETVRWKSIDPGLNLFPVELLRDTKNAVVVATKSGRYRLLAVSAKGNMPSAFAECIITVGTPPKPPPGPGPGPDPPPKPDPKPDPIPAGPRTVLILRESSSDTPMLARLYTSLQAGKAHAYLKSKGHSAFVLDKDTDHARVVAWRDALMLPLPAIAILDDKGKILYKDILPANTTDEDVLAVVKAWETAK